MAPGEVINRVVVPQVVVFGEIVEQKVEIDEETPPGMTVTTRDVVSDDDCDVEITVEVSVGDETHVVSAMLENVGSSN